MPESERVGKAFKLSVADQRITAELQRTLLYFRKAVLTSAGRRRRVVFEEVRTCSRAAGETLLAGSVESG